MTEPHDPFYGKQPHGLIEPEDGGYSFMEWEDVDQFLRFDMFLHDSGLTHQDWAWATTDTTQALHDQIALTTHRGDLLEIAKTQTLIRPGAIVTPDSDEDKKAALYLRCSPPEQKAIEEHQASNPQFGVPVQTNYYVRQWTCGWLSGTDWQPVRPGSMTNSIVATEPVLITSSKNEFGRIIRTYAIRVVKLG